MRRSLFWLLLQLLTINQLSAQESDSALARQKAIEAVKLMDNGEPEKSLPLLEEATRLDRKNIDYSYEMAYAHYQMKAYDKSVDILKKLARRDDADGKVYQLLGNSYDMLGQKDKAIDTYDKGLKMFPAVGNLYLERAIMELKENQYDKGLVYLERGIAAAPMYPSNYYWAAKLFFNSDEEVWGMIYGEIFLNLERNTRRTSEISKLLYLTYKSEIKFNGDSATVSFSKNNVINIAYDPKTGATGLEEQLQKLRLPYGGMIYEPNLLMSVMQEKIINLSSLNNIRSRFVDLYEQKFRSMAKAPIVLFDYQQAVKKAGFMEPYNYWILGYGQEQDFSDWRIANEDLFKRFLEWQRDHRLAINEETLFYRARY